MTSRPTIFISGVSHEFRSFRDAVQQELLIKGCYPENQPGFPPDYRTVEEMLNQKIAASDAVICLIGYRFGAERNDRPPGVPRRSYTQLEFDIAARLGKPIYRFLSASAAVRDSLTVDETTGAMIPDLAQDAEAAALQLAHRQAIESADPLYYSFGDHAQLRQLVAQLPIVAQTKKFRVDISRILKYAPQELIGREAETKILDDAWLKVRRAESHRPHVLTFVALGGEGKTSLVAKWAASLADDNWPGCDAVFAWSFYSQGSREQTAVSSDLFLAEALTFFGDTETAGSAQGAFEKGRRLARLVGERRALLILDGLEPLQYPPNSPTPGELKDQGLIALLRGLAATSHGLCVVTTRYALPDLRAFLGKTVREEKLARLGRAAGVQLLKAHGVTGSDRRNLPLHDGNANSEQVSEFEKLVEDVDGHALTLHIMGSFLKKAFGGDIRKRDRVTFAKASQKTDNDHAFRAMAAYARWMEDGSDEARRELAILRLMGLFDRPATADCLAALLAAPAIPGLTEPLTGLPEEDWNCSLESLVTAKLLTVSPVTVSVPASAFPLPASLDAHPLLREYFAQELRAPTGRTIPAQGNALGSDTKWAKSPEGAAQGGTHGADGPPLQGSGDSGAAVPGALPQAGMASAVGAPNGAGISEAWRAAHRRLYEHLCASTQEGDQPTLEALQPLYQAVAHGCQAGLQQEACDEVYFARITRRDEKYAVMKLGAFGSDLGAIACFFEQPWSRVSNALTEADQAWVLGQAAFRLRALGRLTETLEPMRVTVELYKKQGNWTQAARGASNLSELELTLGEVAGAVGDAEQSVTYADRSGDAFLRMAFRTTHADALHQAGRRAEAEARFREAEQMQTERQPASPLLYSVQGFQYCDLLLAEAERAALGKDEGRRRNDELLAVCRAVSERAAQTLKLVESWQRDILSIALDHLTLGRAALYAALLSSDTAAPSSFTLPTSSLDSAVSGLRRAGTTHHIPRGLLTRAWQRSLTGARTVDQAGTDSAQSDLDEAWEIAARGPMKLLMADVLLHRARLFGRTLNGGASEGAEDTNPQEQYPWGSVAEDLVAAEKLIHACGYHRRDQELADAKTALLPKP